VPSSPWRPADAPRHRQRIARAFGLDQGDVGVQARVLARAAPLGDRLRGAVEQLDRTLFELHPPLRGSTAWNRRDASARAWRRASSISARKASSDADGGFAAPRLLPADLDRLGDAQTPLAGTSRSGASALASRALDAEFGVVEEQRRGFAAAAFGGRQLGLAGAHGGTGGFGQPQRLGRVSGPEPAVCAPAGTVEAASTKASARSGNRIESSFWSHDRSDSAGKGRDGASCLADATQPRRRSVRQG
jgi:hypothetical protein